MYKRIRSKCEKRKLIQSGEEIYNYLVSGKKSVSDLLEIYLTEDNLLHFINAWFDTLDMNMLNKCRNALAQQNSLKVYQVAKIIATYRISNRRIILYTGCLEGVYKEAKYLAKNLDYYINLASKKDAKFMKQDNGRGFDRAKVELGGIISKLLCLGKTIIEICDMLEISFIFSQKCIFTWCNFLPDKRRINFLTILAKKRATPTFILAEKMAVHCKDPSEYRKDFKLNDYFSIIAEELAINLPYYIKLRERVSATNNNGQFEVPSKYRLKICV